MMDPSEVVNLKIRNEVTVPYNGGAMGYGAFSCGYFPSDIVPEAESRQGSISGDGNVAPVLGEDTIFRRLDGKGTVVLPSQERPAYMLPKDRKATDPRPVPRDEIVKKVTPRWLLTKEGNLYETGDDRFYLLRRIEDLSLESRNLTYYVNRKADVGGGVPIKDFFEITPDLVVIHDFNGGMWFRERGIFKKIDLTEMVTTFCVIEKMGTPRNSGSIRHYLVLMATAFGELWSFMHVVDPDQGQVYFKLAPIKLKDPLPGNVLKMVPIGMDVDRNETDGKHTIILFGYQWNRVVHGNFISGFDKDQEHELSLKDYQGGFRYLSKLRGEMEARRLMGEEPVFTPVIRLNVSIFSDSTHNMQSMGRGKKKQRVPLNVIDAMYKMGKGLFLKTDIYGWSFATWDNYGYSYKIPDVIPIDKIDSIPAAKYDFDEGMVVLRFDQRLSGLNPLYDGGCSGKKATIWFGRSESGQNGLPVYMIKPLLVSTSFRSYMTTKVINLYEDGLFYAPVVSQSESSPIRKTNAKRASPFPGPPSKTSKFSDDSMIQSNIGSSFSKLSLKYFPEECIICGAIILSGTGSKIHSPDCFGYLKHNYVEEFNRLTKGKNHY